MDADTNLLAWAAYFGAPALLGYLLGSIPFGLVIVQLAGLGDIRSIGSGNIGATNVLRTGRKDLALATLVLDAGKAGLAFLLGYGGASWINDNGFPLGLANARFDYGLIAGAMAFVGHCYPVWLRFRGGKGVATFIGLLLAAMWKVGLAFCAIWLVAAALFRMSSLAALLATIAAPVLAHVLGYGEFALRVTLALAALVFWRHRANLARILSGKEPRIGAKKSDAPVAATAGADGDPG